ncbi:hypothetical protein [Ruegeria arenilitoris]|uniref:hypothetical protein n=1 Tax=Ruegeria arenilitoris TaxID=1173585 RepID=UPI00147D0F3B|nr:hypothetical protein [Ruegeria arenilitoris]
MQDIPGSEKELSQALIDFKERTERWESERKARLLESGSEEDIKQLAKQIQRKVKDDQKLKAGIPLNALGVQKKAIFLFVLTAAYLLFELAFNARLLDVIGTSVNESDIDHIEMWGRMISGCALTLGFWSLAIRAYKPFRSSLLAMTLVAAACFAASYFIQERILHTISETSTAAQKRAAASLVLITRSIHSHDVDLKGIDLEGIDTQSPEAKTFLAMFPAMAIYTDNVEQKTEREVRQLLRRQVIDDMGGFNHVFKQVYLESEVAINKSFNSYAEGAKKYHDVIATIPREQQEAYRKYRNGLGRQTPYTLPRYAYPQVRNKVYASGVPVPRRWDPRDKATFYRVIDEKIRRQANNRYNSEIQYRLGAVIGPNLNYSQFVASTPIQRKWRTMISMNYQIPLRTGMSPEQFKTQVFEPWVDAIVEDETRRVLAPVSSFEEGGFNYHEGNTAIRIAFVPLVAFTFSIAGALFHIVKTSWLASKSLNARKIVQAIVCISALGVTLWYFLPPTRTPNAVTESVLFNKLETDVAGKANNLTASGIRYLVQFQPAFYPIAEGIRSNILQGFDFGVRMAD